MKYYDIHVQYDNGDGDGYSIPIAVDGDEDAAVEKAKAEDRFEYEEDVNDIDYIDELTKEEYEEMTR